MPRSYTVDELRAAFNVAVEEAASAESLQSLRDQYLGRKRGAVQALLKSVANAPITERRILGKDANQLKQEIEQALDARRKSLEESHDPTGAIDVTLAGRPVRLGHRHPLTIIREDIAQIFVGLGF